MKKNKKIAICEAEIERINYLIANYKYTKEELILFKKLIKNAQEQKKLLEQKKWITLINFLNEKNI